MTLPLNPSFLSTATGGRLRSVHAALFSISLWTLLTSSVAFAQPDSAAKAANLDNADVGTQLDAVYAALEHWQLGTAVKLAAHLDATYPDVPPVQAAVGAVRFYQGDYEGAVRLLQRAAEGGVEPPLLALARSTLEENRDNVRFESKHFELRVPAGKDEILAHWALWALEKAFDRVTKEYDFVPKHRIPVDVLQDASGLANASSLTVKEIKTSGTIALCKYNRLMITSPKALARGYGWLDTLTHEFLHLIISEKSHNTVPIWLHEGLAKYSESLWRGAPGLALDPAAENLLAKATKKGTLITFKQMHPSMAKLPSQEDTALAFAEVFTVVEFLHTLHPPAAPKGGFAVTDRLLVELSQKLSMDQALENSVGMDLKGLQKRWHRYLKKRPFHLVPGAKPRQLTFVKNARTRVKDEGEADDEAALSEAKQKRGHRFVRLGNLLRKRERPLAAIVEYQRAVSVVGPASPSLHNRLAGLLIGVGGKKELKRARTLLRQTLQVFPDDPQSHVLLGRLAMMENDLDAAAEQYDRAAWENPFIPEIHTALYVIGEKTGDKEMQQRAERAVELLRGNVRSFGAGDGPSANVEDKTAGTLSVTSHPWGTVVIDGYDTGITTPLLDYQLTPGAHSVRVYDVTTGHQARKDVTIATGQQERINLILQAITEAQRRTWLAQERDTAVLQQKVQQAKEKKEAATALDAEAGPGAALFSEGIASANAALLAQHPQEALEQIRKLRVALHALAQQNAEAKLTERRKAWLSFMELRALLDLKRDIEVLKAAPFATLSTLSPGQQGMVFAGALQAASRQADVERTLLLAPLCQKAQSDAGDQKAAIDCDVNAGQTLHTAGADASNELIAVSLLELSARLQAPGGRRAAVEMLLHNFAATKSAVVRSRLRALLPVLDQDPEAAAFAAQIRAL